jgi:transcriptional regulator with XRE-family HTH domain
MALVEGLDRGGRHPGRVFTRDARAGQPEVAAQAKALRLARGWKQITLAERSGVSLASLRRFEDSGKVSLQSLLNLAFALNRLEDFEALLQPPPASSIAELKRAEQRTVRKSRRHFTA